MIVVYGEYHWWPKRIAFRNDYCLSCAAERRSIRIRAFLVLHVFGIPILPAGFYKNWRCSVCSRDPHMNPKPSRLFKWLGLYTLIVFALMLWAVPDLVPGSRLVLIGSLMGATLMFLHLLLTRKDPCDCPNLASSKDRVSISPCHTPTVLDPPPKQYLAPVPNQG